MWRALSARAATRSGSTSAAGSGAITAALFLQRFVAPGTPWVHLDTYAGNDATMLGRPEGGEAPGLRALFAGVQELAVSRP